MNKISNSLAILIICLLISNNIVAQTVIDYTTLNSTQCNIFQPSFPVGNHNHTTTCGQVGLDNISQAHAVLLDCNVDASNQFFGTEYKINYPFKNGYTYKIVVSVKASIINNQSNSPILGLDFKSVSQGFGYSCNGAEAISNTYNSGTSITITSSTFKPVEYDFIKINQDYSYLYVGSYQSGPISTSSEVAIASITITEIANTPPDLTFTPSYSFTCGNTSPQTFTVNNPNNVTGITEYKFELGSSSNG